MAYVPVNSFNFNGTPGTAIESIHTSLALMWGGSGYLVSDGTALSIAFSDPNPRMARDTGTYTDDQYCLATLGGFSGTGKNRYVLLAVQYGADTGASSDFYSLIIYNDSPRTTELYKWVNGSPGTALASSTSIAWVSADRALLEIVGGILSVYRDSGSGFGTAVMTYDDSASPYSGGKPGFGHKDGSGSSPLTLENADTGDVTSGGGSATLTAAQGNLSLTGQIASLKIARVLSAAQGSYSLSGQDATLTYEQPGVYTLTANQGSYVITGSDGLAQRAMNAASGSYSLAGQEVSFSLTIPQDYLMSCEFGQYNYTGRAARLIWSGAPIVPGSSSSFTMGMRIGL